MSESGQPGMTPEPVASTSSTPQPEPMGEMDRLIGVLFDPKPAFADIGARPRRWWVPLIILTIGSMVGIVVMTQGISWRDLMMRQIQSNPSAMERFNQIPAAQQEQILRQQEQFVPYIAWAGAFLAWPIVTLVVAGVFTFVFNVLGGKEVPFKAAFVVTCYAVLPMLLYMAASWAVFLLKDPDGINYANPVASNIGALLDPSSVPAWLVSLGNSLDAFVIWILVLLATGFSAAARKLKFGTAMTWVVMTWVLFLAVKVGWVWIFS